jgi:hypothetical protein
MDASVLHKGPNMQVMCVIDVLADLQYDRQRIGLHLIIRDDVAKATAFNHASRSQAEMVGHLPAEEPEHSDRIAL